MNPLRELVDSSPLGPLAETRRVAKLPRFRAEIEALAGKLGQPVEQIARDEIHHSAHGPAIGAFFDFDGTLIDGSSALHLVRDRWAQKQIGLRGASELLSFGLNQQPSDGDFHELIANAVARWKGMTETQITTLWEKLFVRHIAQTVFPEAWALVKALQRKGHTVVIASSATRYQILPLAREMDIAHVLATPLRIRDGVLSGRLAGAPLWNEDKARAVKRFAQQHGVSLDASFGYANGDEDRAFLSSLGRPCAINPKPALAGEADARSWPTLRFQQRRRITLENKLRTVASYAAMAGTFFTGLAAHKLGAPQRRMLNAVISTAPKLGLAAAGIELRITGEENLWKARPAVFVFNHQSPLDLVIGVNLLRRDATGVVKKEMEHMTGWGQFGRFMDMRAWPRCARCSWTRSPTGRPKRVPQLFVARLRPRHCEVYACLQAHPSPGAPRHPLPQGERELKPLPPCGGGVGERGRSLRALSPRSSIRSIEIP